MVRESRFSIDGRTNPELLDFLPQFNVGWDDGEDTNPLEPAEFLNEQHPANVPDTLLTHSFAAEMLPQQRRQKMKSPVRNLTEADWKNDPPDVC